MALREVTGNRVLAGIAFTALFEWIAGEGIMNAKVSSSCAVWQRS